MGRKGERAASGGRIVRNEGPEYEGPAITDRFRRSQPPASHLSAAQPSGSILLLKAHSHRVANQTRQAAGGGGGKSGVGSSAPREIMGIRSSRWFQVVRGCATLVSERIP